MPTLKKLLSPRAYARRIRRLLADPQLKDPFPVETDGPLVWHCPTGDRNWPTTPADLQAFDRLARRVVRNRGGMRFSLPPGVEIITYSNYSKPTLLERCCASLGLPLTVLARDYRPWDWFGKVGPLLDHLRSPDCQADLFLCLDANDTVIVSDLAVIRERFDQTGAEVICCNTVADYPRCQQHYLFELATYPSHPIHCHLSAGGLMGRRTALLEFIQEIADGYHNRHPAFWSDVTGNFEDQGAWRELHRLHYPRIQVDHRSRVLRRFDCFRRSSQ